jgi:hypothetical protein
MQMSDKNKIEKMRELIQAAELLIAQAKEIADENSYSFTVGTSTYDGFNKNWIRERDTEEYWSASGMGC